MNCAACGRELLASEWRCPACGTPAGNVAPIRRIPSRRFGRSRWSSTDVIAGAATLVLLVALFLPWFGVSLGVVGFSVDGLSAHTYLYLVLVFGAAELGYLGVLAGVPGVARRIPWPHETLIGTANVVNLFIVLVAFANKGPSGIGWRYGAFVAVAAAAVAALPKAVVSLVRRVRR